MLHERANILIVEDDQRIGQSLVNHYGTDHRVQWCQNITTAIATVLASSFDLVLLDMHLPDGEGTQVLQVLSEAPGNPQAIILTAFPEHQMAVKTIKMGAVDYLEKPFDFDDLDLLVARTLAQSATLQRDAIEMRQRENATNPLDAILGLSASVRALKKLITTVSTSPDTTVLITGETGTGKELVAEAIHALSARHHRPLVRVNCAALPPSLIEAELFGYEKGAYTDAKKSRRGYIEMAAGGTLFLDEVGELGLDIQAKLLRFLEAKSFIKVGGEREIQIDTRVIAATNREMEVMLKEKTFRADLYYRLNVFEIRLEPLRERPEDISLLFEHYLKHYCRRLGKPALAIVSTFIDEANGYGWPGNIRELRNIAERSALLESFPRLSGIGAPFNATVQLPNQDEPFTLRSLAEVEREHIVTTYSALEHNKTRTAQVLGINRLTLRKKLEEYGLHDDTR